MKAIMESQLNKTTEMKKRSIDGEYLTEKVALKDEKKHAIPKNSLFIYSLLIYLFLV